jgi:hypothetical protein
MWKKTLIGIYILNGTVTNAVIGNTVKPLAAVVLKEQRQKPEAPSPNPFNSRFNGRTCGFTTSRSKRSISDIHTSG